ncbi:hypothetical protein ACGF3J_36540 [Streptomyces sp. NPDC048171]|uniref:hypothetical protein n=1 Tax=Streptomyces sp. NPDC048171 TaxID=3365504 RepID=UPI003710E1AE
MERGHAAFQDRDLSDRDFVYVWPEGVHLKVRLGQAHSFVLVLLGVCFLTTLADTTRLQVQPNAIAGDDGEDDLYDDEHPDMPVLLLITSPAAAEPLSDELSAVGETTRLQSTRS